MATQRDVQVEAAEVGKVAVVTETHTVVRRLSFRDVQVQMEQLAGAIEQKEAELADLKDRRDRLAAVADSLDEKPAEDVGKQPEPAPAEGAGTVG